MEEHNPARSSSDWIKAFTDEREELYNSLKSHSVEKVGQLQWTDRQLELWHNLTPSAISVQTHLLKPFLSTVRRSSGAASLGKFMPGMEKKLMEIRSMSDLLSKWSVFLSSGHAEGVGTDGHDADMQVVRLSLMASQRLKRLRALRSRWETDGGLEDDLTECAMVCSALLDKLIEQKSISDSQIEDQPSGEQQPVEREPSLPSDQSEVRQSVELEDVQPTGTHNRNRGGLYQDMPDEGWKIKSLLNKRVSNDETSYYVEWPGEYKPSWLTEDTVREAATKSETTQELDILISDLESRLAAEESMAMNPCRMTRQRRKTIVPVHP